MNFWIWFKCIVYTNLVPRTFKQKMMDILNKQTSTKSIKQKPIFRTADWSSSVYRLQCRVGCVVTLLNKSHTTPDVQLLQLISIQPLTCFNSVTVSLFDEYSIVEIWRYCLQTCRSLANYITKNMVYLTVQVVRWSSKA